MNRSLLALLLVVFIDAAGIGMLFPILNALLVSPQSEFFSYVVSTSQRHFYYGLVVFVFFISWFFGATFISKASDDLGRKKALLICLIGIFLGYGLTVLAIKLKSIIVLILGRLLGGLTAASQPVAQAAVIDLSNNDNKTRNLGLIMFALSLGLMAGPLIGGILSNSNISVHFSISTPFYVILGITLVNIYLLKDFKDSYMHKNKFRFDIKVFFTQFIPMFKLNLVRKLSLVFFIMQLAFNTFYVFISVYLFQKYGFSTLENSIIMLILGLSMALSTRFLVGFVSSLISNQASVVIGLITMCSCTLLYMLTNIPVLAYILAIPFMLAFGLAYTSMLALFSHSVDSKSQGWVMGITSSLITLGAALTSIINGWAITIDLNAPMIITATGFIISIILILLFKIEAKSSDT